MVTPHQIYRWLIVERKHQNVLYLVKKEGEKIYPPQYNFVSPVLKFDPLRMDYNNVCDFSIFYNDISDFTFRFELRCVL